LWENQSSHQKDGWEEQTKTTKIKGLFVRPEQVANLVSSHKDIQRARVIATREGEMDVMTVKIETDHQDPAAFEASITSTLKLKGKCRVGKSWVST